MLLQLQRPSFPTTSRLFDTPEDVWLPPTFQPSLQAEGKPPLARHTRVTLLCCSCSLEGGRTVRVGRTTPTEGERGRKDSGMTINHYKCC